MSLEAYFLHNEYSDGSIVDWNMTGSTIIALGARGVENIDGIYQAIAGASLVYYDASSGDILSTTVLDGIAEPLAVAWQPEGYLVAIGDPYGVRLVNSESGESEGWSTPAKIE
jgi:hypothetical protein